MQPSSLKFVSCPHLEEYSNGIASQVCQPMSYYSGALCLRAISSPLLLQSYNVNTFMFSPEFPSKGYFPAEKGPRNTIQLELYYLHGPEVLHGESAPQKKKELWKLQSLRQHSKIEKKVLRCIAETDSPGKRHEAKYQGLVSEHSPPPSP